MSTVGEQRPALGPGAQAGRLAFGFIACVALLAAAMWATSNIRRIPADSRAVVMRFGAFVRTQDAGLLLAWPQPFETALLVPGDARVLEQRIASLERDPRALAADPAAAKEPKLIGSQMSEIEAMASAQETPVQNDVSSGLPDALAGSGYILTGDNGAVQLNATLYYRVVDPYAYVLQKERVGSALERVVAAAVVEVTAARDLDSILVARPELLSMDQRMAVKREHLRGDMERAVQRHLDALAASHAALGIEVTRMDVQAVFPAAAVGAFNSVLTSLQTADRNIAQARTGSENIRQQAQQSADRILRDAEASAIERVATSHAETTTILQLETPLDANSDPGLLARAYRERIHEVLSKAGRVTTIDPRDGSSLVLPGKIQ